MFYHPAKYSLTNKNTIYSPSDTALGLYVSDIIKKLDTDVLLVARDDYRLEFFKSILEFMQPEIEVLIFPAWDILPYDRISPKSEIMHQRFETLAQIYSHNKKKIILTTASSFTQKVIPKKVIEKSCFQLFKNKEINRDKFVKFLIDNGFNRSATANEIGDFSIRGSIIDIITENSETGYRIDFFGSEIETIKKFDTLTQISKGSIDEIIIRPVNEVIINKEFIENFKINYKEKFGKHSENNPIFESLDSGRKFIGMENWLSLFYNKLDCFTDYIEDATIIFDHLAESAILEKLKIVDDYYKARLISDQSRMRGTEYPYNPVEPDSMWLNAKEIEALFDNHQVIELSNFNADKKDFSNIDLETKPIDNFVEKAKLEESTPLKLFKNFVTNARTMNNRGGFKRKKILFTTSSKGAKSRVESMFDQFDINHFNINSGLEIKEISGKNVGVTELNIENGFENEDFIFITEQDLFGEKIIRSKARVRKTDKFITESSSLNLGEIIVHQDHGIGRFEGLEILDVSGGKHDFLKITYDGGDILYVPVENIDLLSHYGTEHATLDKLGAGSWQARKAKLKNKIKMAAEELIKTAAERLKLHSNPINLDKLLYDEFCSQFPYVETEDQLRTTQEIQDDLVDTAPMERLVCGDVGFGKTEVALRAAFMVVANNKNGSERKQVAVIVPTTLLCRQHFKTFKVRFSNFSFNVKQLSRLVTAREMRENKIALKNGEIDIIVGTHSLLAKTTEYKNLTMVIIDEEQHFGVKQKERLKQLTKNIHVLSLSATPIPRTLQMSLSGIKKLSLITTPPIDRLAVRTYVMPLDKIIIREAFLREHYRGGRSFFVVPRISDLDDVAIMLKEIVPELKFIIAHGQMTPASLDEIMNNFYDGKYDILVSTTIVESGLDVPGANTIFIHKADKFGLAQLYQLRGRVGRGKIRGYAYLTIEPNKVLSKNSEKRLKVMQKLDSLGAGFNVASHDMDIRGFGNLVGEEQSGHIKEVGVELYQNMLNQAVEEIKSQSAGQDQLQTDFSPIVNMGVSALITESYVADLDLRLGLYQRISELQTDDEIESFHAELIDRFGETPEEVKNLLTTIKIKILCKHSLISKLDWGKKGITISFKDNNFPAIDGLINLIAKKPNEYKLRNDMKLIIFSDAKKFTVKEKKSIQVINEIANLIR